MTPDEREAFLNSCGSGCGKRLTFVDTWGFNEKEQPLCKGMMMQDTGRVPEGCPLKPKGWAE